MTKNLVDRFVAGVKSATRKNFFDTKARGLVLRVSPRAKVWYFTYRNGGPTEWVRIGKYPAMKLAEARTTALDHRHSIDVEGKDPAVNDALRRQHQRRRPMRSRSPTSSRPSSPFKRAA